MLHGLQLMANLRELVSHDGKFRVEAFPISLNLPC